MKNTIKKIMTVSALVVLSGSSLSASSTFSWNDYKEKHIETKNTKNATPVQVQKTKEYVKQTYGISVTKKSLEELKREVREKSMEIGVEFSKMQGMMTEVQSVDQTIDANGDVVAIINTNVVETKPSSYGIYMKGKLDLQSIGFDFNDIYAKAAMYQDLIDVDLTKRVIGDGGKGFAIDVGAGFHVTKKNTYIYDTPLHPYLVGEAKYKTENLTTTIGIKYDLGAPGGLYTNPTKNSNFVKYEQEQEPIYYFSLAYRF
jgi:hypothetical protein